MPTLPYTPQPTTAAVMRSIMARYHADMEAQVDHTLADLQYRWRGVAANLANTISQLESKMAAAERAGTTIDYAWLSQERRLLDLKAAVEGDITRYAQGAKAIIGDAQVAAVASGSESALAALQATEPPGLGYTWGVPPEGVLHQIAGATQPYSPLSQLFDEFGPQASAAAQQALFQSVALGEGAKVAAQRLVYATNMSAQRAEVIARTEIMRSWRHAQMANYQANSDVVSGWIWNCDISPRSCPACLSMDGSIHGLDEELDDHVCGRCSAQPITRPWSEVLAGTGVSDAELASLDEMEADSMPARETGADWLKRQEPTIQNRIMGPAAAEAYRRGDVTLAQLTGITHDPLWGSSIQTRSLRELGLDAQKYLQLARDGGRASVLADEAALAHAAEGTPQQLWREWAAAHNIPDITTAGEGRMATPEEIAAATKRQAEAYREWQRSLASNLPREEGETAFAPLSAPGGHGEVRVYDLTAADRAFLNELRGVVPEGGVTSMDEALALGQPLAERINAATADLRAYAEEARAIYTGANVAPGGLVPVQGLTDAQRAWVAGNTEALAAHGGLRFSEAAQEFQAAYQAQVRAYLSAFRETGGVELNMATDAEKFDALVATRLDAASQLLPADWLQASNDLGELSVERSFARDSSGWYRGRFSGDGTLAMNHNKASDLADLESTALHELTHRMEQAIPQLSDLETEFYDARTAGEEFVDLTNGIQQQTKLDEWIDQYLGREPLTVQRPAYQLMDGTYHYGVKSYELMTMGVQMALSPGASASTFALQADSEYEAFVLGALMGVRAPVAEAVTTAAEDEAAAAVRAAENEIAYAARRAAGTTLSDAERSAIQDAVSAGDLPKSYGKYTSVEQLVKTAKGREWYAANATVKAEVKVAEEAATAARTVLTDAERQALKDAVASGDLPKSYGKYSTVEQLTKTARGRAWYEANATLKAEETAAQAATTTEADAAQAAASVADAAATETEAARAAETLTDATQAQLREMVANREVFTDPNTGRTNFWTGEMNGQRYIIRPSESEVSLSGTVADLADRVGLGGQYLGAETVNVDGAWYEVQPLLAGQQADQATTVAALSTNQYLSADERMQVSLFSSLIGDGDRFANNMWLTPDDNLIQIDYNMAFAPVASSPAELGSDLLRATIYGEDQAAQLRAIGALRPSPEVMDWLRSVLLTPDTRHAILDALRALYPDDLDAFRAQEARIAAFMHYAQLNGTPPLKELTKIFQSRTIQSMLP